MLSDPEHRCWAGNMDQPLHEAGPRPATNGGAHQHCTVLPHVWLWYLQGLQQGGRDSRLLAGEMWACNLCNPHSPRTNQRAAYCH